MDKIDQAFNERRGRIKKTVVNALERHYSDPIEWDECKSNSVGYAIFYNDSCEQWLTAILLYGYDARVFGEKYLLAGYTQEPNEKELSSYNFDSLKDYFIDKSLVALLLNGHFDKSYLQKASYYHYAYLSKLGYPDEVKVLSDPVEPEICLSVFVPQIIVNMLLGIDYSAIVKRIDPEIKSKERIWMYAWRLLHNIEVAKSPKVESEWSQLLNEWKACFAKSDFHSFSLSCFVFIYFLYCNKTSQKFSINQLSNLLAK